MEIQKDLAIVLRSVQYEERHKILTAITEHHGLVSGLAKNSIQSRRFGGALDLFTASEWIFKTKPHAELVQITEAHLRNSFEKIRQDFEKLSLASLLNEFLIKLAPQNEPCPDLFKLHSNALFALHTDHEAGNEVFFLNAYLAKLLQWSGNQPRLRDCLQCSVPLESFEPSVELSCLIGDAGWICPACRIQSTRHVGQGFNHSFLRATCRAIQDFQLSLSVPIRQYPQRRQASQQEHRALFKWIEALYVFHIPGFDRRPLKSLRFLGLESSVPLQEVNLQ